LLEFLDHVLFAAEIQSWRRESGAPDPFEAALLRFQILKYWLSLTFLPPRREIVAKRQQTLIPRNAFFQSRAIVYDAVLRCRGPPAKNLWVLAKPYEFLKILRASEMRPEERTSFVLAEVF